MLSTRRRSARGAVAALAAVAFTLGTAGCTTRTDLGAGTLEPDFTERWSGAAIAQVPPGTLHRLSRYELHDEPDPLLHLEPGERRTGYVMRYATEMDADRVVDYYLDRHAARCTFDTADLDQRSRIYAACDDIGAEIRLVGLVHAPDELPEIRALRTEVTVIVSDATG
jgi:hypothetical protein